MLFFPLKKIRAGFGRSLIPLFPVLFFLLFTLAFPAAAAPGGVPREAFLSQLLGARGFAGSAAVSSNVSAILKSGIVTDEVSSLSAPVTRGQALRWMIQSLGLSAEAGFLSELPLPFKDLKEMSAYDRGCLVVATHMDPPLFKKHSGDFAPGHLLTPNEVKSLMASVKRADQHLRLEARFAPITGMELELHREGTFSGFPKWRVHVYGFDEKIEAEAEQQIFAEAGFSMEVKNPNYEWSLRNTELMEDYAQVRQLSELAGKRGKAVYVFPSLMNENLENQPLYWALLTIDPSRYMIEPIIAPDGITALAPLSSMMKNSGVQAALNAGFFAVSGRNAGSPIGTLQIARTLVNRPYKGRTSLGWSANNRATFGEVSWEGILRIEEGWMTVDSLNHAVKGNAVALYNVWYGKPTPLSDAVTEAIVRGDRCVSIRFGGGTAIEPGSYVLAGYGTNADLLTRYLKTGDAVHLESTFNGGNSPWDEMDNIIQAGPFLLRDGEIRIESEGFSSSILNLRHPRSAIGLTKKGKWIFFVGDGRNGLHSAGFTLQDMALILRTKGVAWALNLDGGGSSQIMVKGKMYNLPSDGRERPLSYAVGARQR
ncbi:MAG: phosphodiester glycosidase family protein [Synergistaceae bacterium]|nr:phosphodiester glycosidase family protein [Synergistaceae bacterium]